MTYRNIRLEIEDRIAIVTISNPPANALNQLTLQELDDAFTRLEADPQTKAIVLTGEGRFFIAGADIKEFTQLHAEDAQAMSENGQRLFDRIERFAKPVIAAINGACLGGGLELAMSCHMRLASPEAKLGLPEVNLGLIPGYGGTQRLPRLIGRGLATKMIVTAEMITGSEAQRIGLVEAVYPVEQLLTEAKNLARLISAKSGATLRLALAAIDEGCRNGLHDGLSREAELFAEAFRSEDSKEGVGAFLEKRTPQFMDR